MVLRRLELFPLATRTIIASSASATSPYRWKRSRRAIAACCAASLPSRSTNRWRPSNGQNADDGRGSSRPPGPRPAAVRKSCLELGLLGAPRRRPVDVVLRISTNRSWRPLLKFGCLNSHFGCAYVSRNRFGRVLMEEKYCRDASTRASCAAPSLSHGRSLLFRAAALEGRPVPLGADAVPSPESVGSTLARQAWPRRRVQSL